MKCSNVQSVIIEYAEGALGPADEMCIDIHLIQCEECRAELAGLRDLMGSVAHEVHCCEACDDAVEFLDRFHALEMESTPPLPLPVVRQARLPILRIAAAAIAVAIIVSSGFLGHRGSARFTIFAAPVAEARTNEMNLSPYLRNGLDMADLKKMGLVGSIKSDPTPGGD